MSPQLSSNNDNTPEFGPAERGIRRAICSICKPARVLGGWWLGGEVDGWVVGVGVGVVRWLGVVGSFGGCQGG